MSLFDVLVLVGLVMQIVASFILSVEVIGLDRVARWTNSLSLLRSDLTDDKKERPFFSRGSQIPRIYCGVMTMLGIVLMHFYMEKYLAGISSLHRVLAYLVGSILLGVITASLYEGVLYAIKAAVYGLRAIESRSRARSSGILGFLLLLVGFMLQFIGTLGQSLSK